jgi:hypothetical protein
VKAEKRSGRILFFCVSGRNRKMIFVFSVFELVFVFFLLLFHLVVV